MLDERLMEILICPVCRGGLEHKERRHVLLCANCALQYPVREGIPIMLPEEASRARQR